MLSITDINEKAPIAVSLELVWSTVVAPVVPAPVTVPFSRSGTTYSDELEQSPSTHRSIATIRDSRTLPLMRMSVIERCQKEEWEEK